jgi:predicted anti-sigma-YlaC factor YlaD
VSCNELVEHVTDYLEGAMAPEERLRVDEHLAECDGCTTYLEQMRTTIRLTGMLTEQQVTDEARVALLEAFRDVRSA